MKNQFADDEKDGEWWRRFFRPDYWFSGFFKHQYRWFSEELENKNVGIKKPLLVPNGSFILKECCIEFIRNLCD